MKVLEFEWDPNKAKFNLKKHKISFCEAQTVFADPFADTYFDPDHSTLEERWITLGESVLKNILIVAHTSRQDKIRIISARKATPKERKNYEN